MGVLGDRQLDAALIGLRGLAEKQCDKRGFADIGGQPVHQLLGQFEFVGRELDRLVGTAHLDHGDHGVQLVGGLVRLRAQRVRQHLKRAEFAKGALQFGAVADGDDLRCVSVLRPLVIHLGAVDHEHPVVGDVHLVARARVVGAQELGQVRLGRRDPVADRAVAAPRR